ncbi:MAG TPA: hypothetical protein VGL27_10420, partial [Negativicutes bacterium]
AYLTITTFYPRAMGRGFKYELLYRISFPAHYAPGFLAIYFIGLFKSPYLRSGDLFFIQSEV